MSQPFTVYGHNPKITHWEHLRTTEPTTVAKCRQIVDNVIKTCDSSNIFLRHQYSEMWILLHRRCSLQYVALKQRVGSRSIPSINSVNLHVLFCCRIPPRENKTSKHTIYLRYCCCCARTRAKLRTWGSLVHLRFCHEILSHVKYIWGRVPFKCFCKKMSSEQLIVDTSSEFRRNSCAQCPVWQTLVACTNYIGAEQASAI